jgi:Rieske 2Fe-2S family protein
MSAPLDADDVLAALRPHGESVTLPAAAYLDEKVLCWERRQLFSGGWTVVGRVGELRDGGVTQRAVAVGDIGVLLTFADETVRALANVCRHRGHELLPIDGCSARQAVVCPYHGWAYRLDGQSRVRPGYDGPPLGLVELPAVDWHGWLAVNATGTAPSFVEYVGALDGLVAPYAPAKLALRARHTYEVMANWKVVVENYHECYHCPQIHPQLCEVSPPDSGTNWRLPGAWVGGSMRLREGARTMSLDGDSAGRPLPGVDQTSVRYLGLFPNLLISAHPDYVMAHRLRPLAAGRTLVECSWFFPPEVSQVRYAVDFWDLTNRQDWAACESVQRGIANPHFRPGPLAAREDAVYRWTTLIACMYLDPHEGLVRACGPD